MSSPKDLRHFADSDELCRHMRETFGETILLSFSLGKDSVAAWLQARRYFPRIIPFYMDLIPGGLSFVNEAVTYYEQFFGTPILRVPNPSLSRMLRNAVYQPSSRLDALQDINVPVVTRDEVEDYIRGLTGVGHDTYTALGTRAADSAVRRNAVEKFGSVTPARRTFLPVFDWAIDRMHREFAEAGVKLPADYRMFGISFDGVDWRFTEPLKRLRPDDYAKIKRWFPLCDLDHDRRIA